MEEELRGFYTPEKKGRLSVLLRQGGVAVLPTDTIYGLHCIAGDPAAVDRIGALKGRGSQAGYILIASDIEMVDGIVEDLPAEVRRLLSRVWPAGLTAILPAARGLHPGLRPGNKVAVRVPDLLLLREITREVGAPLISTSVNCSGQPPLRRISEIRRIFPGLEAYISRSGRPAVLPSTIIDFCEDPFRVVRRGVYDLDDLP